MGNMFCFQCQEAAGCKACTVQGCCGKTAETSNAMDTLIYVLKQIAVAAEKSAEADVSKLGRFIIKALFTTITNAQFDTGRVEENTAAAKAILAELVPGSVCNPTAAEVRVDAEANEDVRSLRELLIYGLKGAAAYTDHALILGYENPEIYEFMIEGLAATTKEKSVDELVALVLKCGDTAVKAMALLDEANTTTFGNPEISTVNIGVGTKPGILVSGHDLKDIKQLLEQTEGTGVDVYTHCEMLPSHYYPELKKYEHLRGNYGGSWWKQRNEFKSFNGPILMTTNCITPVSNDYKDRMFTTGQSGYPGVTHLQEPADGEVKDFSAVIALAKTCPPPTEIETGEIVGGFAHNQVLALADKVVAAVKAGKIGKFVVMAGCDGRQASRQYYTDTAQNLPKDAIILTAGCAKYRYNKLALGDIDGIPRVLDAGQCNDCYSLAVIAMKLQEAFELDDINDLPLEFDIAWYEQKAVTVLLALLALGFKNIKLGPTLPAFLSPGVTAVLVENFNISGI
jgi:hydroxylamine reductase